MINEALQYLDSKQLTDKFIVVNEWNQKQDADLFGLNIRTQDDNESVIMDYKSFEPDVIFFFLSGKYNYTTWVNVPATYYSPSDSYSVDCPFTFDTLEDAMNDYMTLVSGESTQQV